MEAAISDEIQANIQQQLATLHALQTLPFQAFVADYLACLQQCQEQEVRAVWYRRGLSMA